MTVVRLHRHAPEAHFAQHCAVCGTTDTRRLTDHVQAGPPGTPTHDEVMCEHCGGVITSVTQRYGSDLTMHVDEAQRMAGDGEITTPRPKR